MFHSVRFNKLYFMINYNPFISLAIQYQNILPKLRPSNPDVFFIFVILTCTEEKKQLWEFSTQQSLMFA